MKSPLGNVPGNKIKVVAAVLLGFSTVCTSYADDSASAERSSRDPLRYSDFHTYNPLDSQHSVRQHRGGSQLALSNADLQSFAEFYKSGEINASQRALNYQWLAQFSDEDKVYEDNKALQKILQMGLKTYWNNLRDKAFKDNKVIPDGDGKGSFSSEMDYKLRFSGDKVKLAIEYSF